MKKNEHRHPERTEPPLSSRAGPIFARAPLPMIEVEGPDHRVTFVNAAFCLLAKKEKSALVGSLFSEIVSNGEKCIPLLDRVYQTGEFETHSLQDETDARKDFWLFAMWPTLDGNDSPVGVVVQLTKVSHPRTNTAEVNEALLIAGLRQHELREVAERANLLLESEIGQKQVVENALRLAQTQLHLEAERLEEKVAERTKQLRASIGELEAFSYSLVHDLRAPVRAMHGFSQMALELPRDELGPNAAKLIGGVVKSAVRMDSLIQDVLSLSEVILKPIKTESVNVDDLLIDLLRERPEFEPERAEIKIDRPLLRMRGHEASLGQCVSNLLGNAVKFVAKDEKPWVHIWTEKLPPMDSAKDSDICGTDGSESRVRLWIEDHGIGIAVENQEKIFQIFQRLHSNTEYEGTGIGLAIVRKAIERMGGAGGVDSVVGQGSRFWLDLPAG